MGQRLDVMVRQVVAVVGTGCAQLDRESDAATVSELVAVHPQAQSYSASGLKDSTGLVYVEGPDLTEDVNPADMGDKLRSAFDRTPDLHSHLRSFLHRAPDEPQGGDLVDELSRDLGADSLVLYV
ncbi:MAG: hypothetical protein U0R21_08145 [Nocardioidaceae bacterium]